MKENLIPEGLRNALLALADVLRNRYNESPERERFLDLIFASLRHDDPAMVKEIDKYAEKLKANKKHPLSMCVELVRTSGTDRIG